MRPRPDFGEESYHGTGKWRDRVAIITGADSGIGRAVAVAFAREGADIVISYLSEHRDAQETAAVVRDAGRRALLIPGDIQDEHHCREVEAPAIRLILYRCRWGNSASLINVNFAFPTSSLVSRSYVNSTSPL